MIIYLEALGCSRNLVDSEIMLGRLKQSGHTITDDPAQARVIIVNTCGFISTAADEAVDVILEMAKFKETGACEKLIATGCLVQRYKDDKDLAAALPEVDVFLGTAACDLIADAVQGKKVKPLTLFPDPAKRAFQDLNIERKLLSDYFAYIKVSEGCRRKCTYCIIPKLRGIQRSRPIKDIVKEGTALVSKGVKEIILTAENTTDYGHDSGSGKGFETVLSSLGEKIGQIDHNAWIRFLYTHPCSLTSDIIRQTAQMENICSYYDVPIQHASSNILKLMGRPYTRKDLYTLFDNIRKMDPRARLRTTIITGFPTETDKDFDTLLAFIEDIGFDHLGVFTYSDSHDLKSHLLKDHVPKEVAQERHDLLMAAQARISAQINESYVGEVFTVLVEESPEPGLYLGRTMFQAPEVDGVTFIYADRLEIGSFVRVKITGAHEYDISGELA
ncbi:MAG: 30S ribosomal protein S12 methylthiotransferase RimO [Desulfobacteraceae bacterium]|nr:30S ribosomal protein S12 methylthiotransferase RimO [Desulfobacteraceae bacterium]